MKQGWGRLGWCFLAVLTHCAGRSKTSVEKQGPEAGAGASSAGRAGESGGAGARPGRGGSGAGSDGLGGAGDGAGGDSAAGEGAVAGTRGDPDGGSAGDGGNDGNDGTSGSGGEGGSGGTACDATDCEFGRACVVVNDRAVCDCGPGLFGAKCEVSTVAITVGSSHACLLRSDGEVSCWGGSSADGVVSSPSDRDFTAIAAQRNRSCGLRNGHVTCWNGSTFAGHEELSFESLAVNDEGVCGIAAGGEVTCYANASPWLAGVSDAVEIVAGDAFTCVRRTNGAVTCWGTNPAIAEQTPADAFVSVAAGTAHMCGVTTSGGMLCWGKPGTPETQPPALTFIAAAAGYSHSCRLLTDQRVVCWGSEESAAPEGQFVSIAAGGNSTCGIETNGRARCWGGSINAGDPPGGAFRAIAAGCFHACALRLDGTVTCFGPDGGTDAPPGAFASLDAGDEMCGLRANGAVHCWGGFAPVAPLGGEFVSVATGHRNNCGIRASGAIECWGQQYLPTPPVGAFISVAVGDYDACAIRRSDSQAVCWGSSFPMPQYEMGTFIAVSMARTHQCFLDPEHRASCSGDIESPPDDTFRSLSSGYLQACGITTEGRLRCWGAVDGNWLGTLPTGADFQAVSAGDNFVCALRNDGSIRCWGTLARKDLPPQTKASHAIWASPAGRSSVARAASARSARPTRPAP